MQPEARHNDSRKTLDNLSSVCCNDDVIRAAQVAEALSQQAKGDFNRIAAIESEQKKLMADYLRYKDLEAEKKAKSDRLRRTASLIPNHLQKIRAQDEADEFDAYMVKVSELSLWEAMLAILEHTGEIQLYDLQHVLEQLGKKVTRGAVESAVTTHPDKFQAKTRGRERFVSLKR
jgi:hypothetical protein